MAILTLPRRMRARSVAMADFTGKRERPADQASSVAAPQRPPGKTTLVDSTYGRDGGVHASAPQSKGDGSAAPPSAFAAAGAAGSASELPPYARSFQPLFGDRHPDEPDQFLGSSLDGQLPAGAEAPAHGEDPGQQRRYSVDQYIEMWEKEQGRKMHVYERATVEQGCIGITLNNLQARGRDPLSLAEGTYGTFDQAFAEMTKRNEFLDQLQASKQVWSRVLASMVARSRYVLFAQLFWSNQSDHVEERKQPAPNAFLPDPKTGKMDMTGYKYLPRMQMDDSDDPYTNFDFGFWDEATQTFWHANHMRYKDPARDALDPMEVYQSTKELYLRGHSDFDRVVFAIARATNYDARLAAGAHKKPKRSRR